jgi:hypothetical protein
MRRLTATLTPFFFVVLFAASAWAVGETNGRIGGAVTDKESGAPVPGATIEAHGRALIGPPRTVTTDDAGRYEITELPPGSYDVTISYAGVKPVLRRVVVRQGELLPLDIVWSAELVETEVTVVVEERHMTKPDSTQTGTVISLDTSSKVATQREYQDIALQVAGTVDVNGGGNPQVKGGNLMMNRYLVDGLDITDPVTNTFSANINFDSISSIDVITGGMEAQYNALGGIINLITNGGSNEWHVDSSLYVGNNLFSVHGQYGPQTFHGLTPLSKLPSASTQSYQANLNVGGPLVKNKLWFNASVEYDYTESGTPAGPPLNLQGPPRRFNGVLARIKLTWAPNEKHRLTVSASSDPSFISNTGAPNSALPVAQTYQEQGGAFGIIQWDWFARSNVNFNLQTGFVYNHIYSGPQGFFSSIDDTGAASMFSSKNAQYNLDEPGHTNQVDGSIWYQGASAIQFDRRYRVQFDPSVSLRGRAGGSHDAKIGLQVQYLADQFAVKQTGMGISYTDGGANGGPLEGGLCNEATGAGGCFLKTVASDYQQTFSGVSVGGYLQDRWKPLRRLTVVPGIRFDYGWSQDSAGRTATNLFGVGPRLGAIVDLTGDEKTIFSAFYGRANDVQNMLPAGFGSPTPLTRTYLWNPMTNKFDTQVGASGGSMGVIYDPSTHEPPHTDEVTASLRREVFRNSVATVDYTYKRVSNIWDWYEINRLWDPSGFRQLTDVNGNPLYANPGLPQDIFKITTNHPAIREYQGVDFSVESRPNEHWDIYVAYTLAWLYGQAGEEFSGQVNGTSGAFFNPRQTHLWDGFLPEDVRHQLKVRASYNTHGVNIGTFIVYRTGAPLSHNYFEFTDGSYLNLRAPTGTDPAASINNARGFAELRTPDVLEVDVRASYDFQALIRQHLILIVDIFNLFNLRTATAIENRDLPTFGTVAARQQPFRFQLGLRYNY